MATIEDYKKLTEQFIVDPSVKITNLAIEPWTPYWRTNNFIQNSFSRLLAYDKTAAEWERLLTDGSGRLFSKGFTDGSEWNFTQTANLSPVLFDQFAIDGALDSDYWTVTGNVIKKDNVLKIFTGGEITSKVTTNTGVFSTYGKLARGPTSDYVNRFGFEGHGTAIVFDISSTAFRALCYTPEGMSAVNLSWDPLYLTENRTYRINWKTGVAEFFIDNKKVATISEYVPETACNIYLENNGLEAGTLELAYLEVGIQTSISLSPLGNKINLNDREFSITNVMKAQEIPDASIVTHDGVDLAGYSGKSVLIDVNGTATIYYQFSSDNENWFDLYTSADAAVTTAIANQKKAVPIDDVTRYFRVLVYNVSGSALTANITIMGLV